MTVSAERDRRATPTRARARSLLMQAGALGLFLVVIAATALAGRPTLTGGALAFAPPQPSDVRQTLTPAPSPPPVEQQEPNPILIIIGIVLFAIVAIVLLIGLVRLARSLLAAFRDRMREMPDAAATETAIEPAPDETVDAPTVQRGVAAALSAVAEHRDPGDAIVAAWLGLEEAAADAGAGRGRAETPAEFTLRILLTRPGIGDPARALLRLYEQVRFGGRQADESMRLAAARALADIERGWR